MSLFLFILWNLVGCIAAIAFLRRNEAAAGQRCPLWLAVYIVACLTVAGPVACLVLLVDFLLG